MEIEEKLKEDLNRFKETRMRWLPETEVEVGCKQVMELGGRIIGENKSMEPRRLREEKKLKRKDLP